MIYGLGAVSLDNVVGGTLTSGIVPFPRMQRQTASGRNLGVVTLLAGVTEIVALSSLTVTLGDVILVWCRVKGTKGGVGGAYSVTIKKKSGTAAVVFISNTTSAPFEVPDCPAGADWKVAYGSVIQVTGSGTLVLQYVGDSQGSDSTVQIASGQLAAYVLYGA